MFKSPPSSSYNFIPNTTKLETFTYSKLPIYRFSHSQTFAVVGPLGVNLSVFSPLRFDVQTNSDHNIKRFHSARALNRYLDEKNMIHGLVMATISKFNPQSLETYFRCICNTSLSCVSHNLIVVNANQIVDKNPLTIVTLLLNSSLIKSIH